MSSLPNANKLLVQLCELIDALCDNFGTNWRQVFSFTLWPLYSVEGTPGTHGIGGWVGARAGLDMWEKRKLSHPCRESKPGWSSP